MRDGGVEGLALLMQMLGEVEQHDAVLDHEADEQNDPHRRRDVQIGAGQHQQQQGPAERQGCREQNQHSRYPGAELDHENREDEYRRDAEDHQQLAERLLL